MKRSSVFSQRKGKNMDDTVAAQALTLLAKALTDIAALLTPAEATGTPLHALGWQTRQTGLLSEIVNSFGSMPRREFFARADKWGYDHRGLAGWHPTKSKPGLVEYDESNTVVILTDYGRSLYEAQKHLLDGIAA